MSFSVKFTHFSALNFSLIAINIRRIFGFYGNLKTILFVANFIIL